MEQPPGKDVLTLLAAKGRYIAVAVCTAAYLHAVWMSWLKWGDLVVDAGVEYELPRKLADGQLLYRDVDYWFGPVPVYFNALLYRVFGVHASVLAAAGLTIAALMCVLLYRLARCFAGRLCACCVTVSFIYICGFAHLVPNASFNFVIPYTFAATYGMLFALASLFFLIRHVQKGAKAKFWLSVLFLTLAALSKIEILFAAGMLHLAFLIAYWRLGRLSVRAHFPGYGAVFAVVILTYVLFLVNAPGMFAENPWYSPNPAARMYMRSVMGLADWRMALWCCVRYSFLGLAGVLAAAWVLAAVRGRWSRNAWVAGGALAAAFLAGALIYQFYVPKNYAFLVLPELFAALLVFLVWRWFRAPEQRAGALPTILLLVFALAVLARIPLRTWAWHYGFYLLPVPLAAFGVLWFKAFANWLGRSGPVFSAAGVGLFLALSLGHYRISTRNYALHTVSLETPRGSLCLLGPVSEKLPYGAAYAECVLFLSRLPPETRVLVVPLGVGLVFFSGLDSPYGETGYLPTVPEERYNCRLLPALKARPPDVVVRVRVDAREFGSQGFGVDYAVEMWEWIAENYEPVKTIGQGDSIVVLRRRGAKPQY